MLKTIIFDFDGTLFNGDAWSDWDNYIMTFLNQYFSSEKEKQKFLHKYFCNNSFLSERTICEGLIKEFGDSMPMVNYLIDNPYDYSNRNIVFIKNDYLKELSKSYNLYIVSNTPSSTIKTALKQYGIDTNIFKDYLFNPLMNLSTSKKEKYQKILKAENNKPNEVIVFGDSLTDIEPAKQLGMNYLLTKSLDDIYNYKFENIK